MTRDIRVVRQQSSLSTTDFEEAASANSSLLSCASASCSTRRETRRELEKLDRKERQDKKLTYLLLGRRLLLICSFFSGPAFCCAAGLMRK
jgi:hypothetical protein